LNADCSLPRADAHPAYVPFARWLPAGAVRGLPSRSTMNGWACASGLALPDGRPLTFAPPWPGASSALAYEARVARRAEVATRDESLHDAWNALAWLAFPRTKAALNAVHVEAGRVATPNARDRRRDAATLLDESGVLVACVDAALLAHWRSRRWREAFALEDARDVPTLTAVAIGHGLLAKLAAPFRGITGRALVLAVDPAALPQGAEASATALDAAAARAIAAHGATLAPEQLLPVPVAALPGWDLERLGARLFDDVAVFRPPPPDARRA
jgi:hypothetical protein